MTIEEAARRLRLFGIPVEGDGAEDVRNVLARILAGGALSLSDMQSARDVAEHLRSRDPGVYLFLAAMRLSQKAGNTFLRIGKGADMLKAAARSENVEDWACLGHVDALWKRFAAAAGERLARGDGQLVVCKDVGNSEKGWFFARVWNSVKAISDRLGAMSAEEDLDGLAEDIVGRSVLFGGGNGQFSLNDEQRQAVRTVGKRRFTVITGGPGTGKTTVICAILRALLESEIVTGEDVALVAPTGRAGQRMAESIRDQCDAAPGMPAEIKRQIKGMSGTTIHTALGGLPPDWKYTKENRLPYKLMIVDESSMIDVHLMKALLEALSDRCRLVLLGDKDQLPSVDAGAVLGDVVANFDERTVVELKKSNRFTGALADCARAVNAGDGKLFAESVKTLPVDGEAWTDALFKTDEDDVNRVFRCELDESAKPAAFRKLVLEWVRGYGSLPDRSNDPDKADGGLVAAAKAVEPTDDVFKNGGKKGKVAELFKRLERSRILTVVRKGPFGAAAINDLVITERFGGRRPANALSKVGVPVIVTRNTRERNLWNGDIGVTVKGPDGMVVLFPRGKEVAVCPVGLLPEHELAYAMTVHKSQGSEFGNVMVVLPNDGEHPLLNRQIVYTGITRAKKRAVIVGPQGALDAALARQIVRDTGLASRK